MNAPILIQRTMRRYYNTLGTAMVFRSPATSKIVTISAIDRTAAYVVVDKDLQIGTTKRVATVLRSDLAALKIAPESLVDVTVTFGGETQRILTASDRPNPAISSNPNLLRPVPNWEMLGELMLTLMVAT